MNAFRFRGAAWAGGVLLALLAAASPAAGQTPFLVAPTNTDPNITQVYPLEQHWVYPPVGHPRGRLLLFLPGTLARPTGYQGIMKAGASAGLHVIGLIYVNTNDVSSKCLLDCPCYEDYRKEMIDGTDRTTNLVVNRANSIENRLNKLLQFMTNAQPAGGWGQYLDSQTNAVWSNIVVAGHSQGGGHAAMLGHTRRVSRVLMFAWSDRCVDPPNPAGPPPWVSTNNPTPADRYFGFQHTGDTSVVWTWATQTWQRLGMSAFGEVEAFENAPSPPHGPTHSFLAVTEPRGTNGAAAHNATVVDQNTPTNGAGSFVYAPLWTYMMIGPTAIPSLTLATNGLPNSISARWPAVEEATYVVERSTNMTQWSAIAGPIDGIYGLIVTNLPGVETSAAFRLRLPY